MANWESLRRQIAICGQVTAVSGSAPIPNARVQLTAAPVAFQRKARAYAKLHGSAWETLSERVDRTLTAADGAYYFLDLPDGDYTITAYLSERLPTYDYAESSATVSRTADGTIQAATVDVALPDYTGKPYAPVFTPTSLADCQLWLQADALTLADEAAVSSWEDSSEQGVIVEAATPPTLKHGQINGRSAVQFDGSSTYFTLNLATESTEHTIFAVVDHAPTEGSSNYLFEAQTGRLTLDCAQSSAPHNIRWNDGSWRAIAPAIAGVQMFNWRFGGTTGELWRNGQSLGTVTYTPKPIGGKVTLGANYQGRSSNFRGSVAEFVYFSRALEDKERQAVEAYLNGRYAIFS